MNYQAIIDKYYPEENELKHILLVHSRSVADKALMVAERHPELHLDCQFLEEAAMLHDIGIIRCDAPGIQCFGSEPYIFFSKTHLDKEKTVEQAEQSLAKFGEEGVLRFREWEQIFC